jgi:hypothetical protein
MDYMYDDINLGEENVPHETANVDVGGESIEVQDVSYLEAGRRLVRAELQYVKGKDADYINKYMNAGDLSAYDRAVDLYLTLNPPEEVAAEDVEELQNGLTAAMGLIQGNTESISNVSEDLKHKFDQTQQVFINHTSKYKHKKRD